MTKLRSLRVDIGDVVMAMDMPLDLMPDLQQFLDKESGRIITISSDDDDDDIDADAIACDGERYVRVPGWDKRDEYDLMVAFADAMDEEDIREQLEHALRGKGAFGRFRNVISPHPDLEERWYTMLHDSRIERAVAWLRENGIEPEYETRKPMPKPTEPPKKKGAPPSIGLLELALLGGHETELISGRVLRHVVLPNPSAARRVFKSVAREMCGYVGVGWRKRFIEGKKDFHMGGLHLEIDGSRVELAIEVPTDVWQAFRDT